METLHLAQVRLPHWDASRSCVGRGWYRNRDILALYTTRAQIMARAARTQPATNTKFRFRPAGKSDPVRGPAAPTLPLQSLPGPRLLSADPRKRRGPWEMKCLPFWDPLPLFLRLGVAWAGGTHPREHLLLGSPAVHIITWQLMYT